MTTKATNRILGGFLLGAMVIPTPFPMGPEPSAPGIESTSRGGFHPPEALGQCDQCSRDDYADGAGIAIWQYDSSFGCEGKCSISSQPLPTHCVVDPYDDYCKWETYLQVTNLTSETGILRLAHRETTLEVSVPPGQVGFFTWDEENPGLVEIIAQCSAEVGNFAVVSFTAGNKKAVVNFYCYGCSIVTPE